VIEESRQQGVERKGTESRRNRVVGSGVMVISQGERDGGTRYMGEHTTQ